MKVILINGSPRKNWNTDQALQKAAEGIAEAGGTSETIRLYDYAFKGCVECYACKIKGSKTNGLCAYRDELRPVLEKVHEADAVIVGAPVFYNYPAGQVRSFLERWLFPVGTYLWEDGRQIVVRDKVIPTGLIYTMNCPKDMMEDWNYPAILSDTANTMKQIMGDNELLYICNTYQFRDYARYDMNLFSEEEKHAYRDAHFAEDLEKAKQMGVSIAQKALAIEKAKA
ncbi:MAG: flavodoxin family protein [Eubacterium sp.]|nr:flavodoxin family protein [Eubacterium sp.]